MSVVVILFGLLGVNFTEALPYNPLKSNDVIRHRRNIEKATTAAHDEDAHAVAAANDEYHYDIVPVIEVEPAADGQQNDVLVIDEYVVRVRNGDDKHDEDGDLDLAASSHIFRPLFRYRAEIERKRIIRGTAAGVTGGGTNDRPQRRYYYSSY